MNPRGFLIRGLLAGLLAGLAAFAVASVVGEPPLDQAIAVEETNSTGATPPDHATHAEAEATHTHDHETAVVSREVQSTWGLLTGTLAIGITLGGVAALIAAIAMGRLGRLSPAMSTAVVTAVGYVSFALVPFLKYPSSPPGVGDPSTIGQRTLWYFTFAAISVLTAAACILLARTLVTTQGPHRAVLAGGVAYLLAVGLAAALMPSIQEAGSFPGDVLWAFRLASALTSAAMWAVLGIVLTWMIHRLNTRQLSVRSRRALAESI